MAVPMNRGRRGHADDRLPLAGAARGDGPAQVVQGAGTRLDVVDRRVQQPAQGQFVGVEPVQAVDSVEPFGALVVGAVVHSSVPSVRWRVLVPVAPRRLVPGVGLVSFMGVALLGVAVTGAAPFGVVAHAGASMATRSAAMPREPYAFTEPSDMPRVSATWASVMSAK